MNVSTSDKRRLTAEDLYDITRIGALDVSRPGDRIVWTQTRQHRAKQKTWTDLWVARVDAAAGSVGEPQRFTWGDCSDSMPRISPDGRTIAFLSNRGDEKQSQVYLLPVDGGEARPLTDVKGSFGDIDWSPDGRTLLCTVRRKDADAVDRDEDDAKKELGIVCRHITRIHYKEDGAGYLPNERFQLVTVAVDTGELTWLTDDPTRDAPPARWSPDGQSIVFARYVAPDPDLESDNLALFIRDMASGDERQLPGPVGPKSGAVFSPDGSRIAWYGVEGLRMVAHHACLWVQPADGSAGPVNLTGTHDREMGDVSIADLGAFGGGTWPEWAPDGRAIYTSVSHHGRTQLCRVNPDDPAVAPEPVIDGEGVMAGCAFSADHRVVVWQWHTINDHGRLLARLGGMESKDDRRVVAEPNAALFAQIDLHRPEEVWIDVSDGHRIQGWILTPPDFDPSKTWPSIIEIHGGPLAQYSYSLMHEFHWLAAQGYVVAFCNPRGGFGYGEKHAQAILHRWGTVDYDDVMAFADHLASQPYIDTDRMGVTGGSYGGYMTNWIIGRSQRFKAACTQRCVSNLISMVGSSDYNWHFRHIFADGKAPWEDGALESYWAQSPIKDIGNATTPTLVIHSMMDLRCEQEQGEQVYTALKRAGVDTELVLFPDEPHGLSRGGRTDRRIARLNHILDWFNRYLQPAETN